MVVDDLHVIGIAILEAKAQAPTRGDSNAELALAIAAQLLDTVRGRIVEVLDRVRGVKHLKLGECPRGNAAPTAVDLGPVEQLPGAPALEANDHA